MNAERDENSVHTLIAGSNLDGQTIIRAEVTPAHQLQVNVGNSGTDYGPQNALRDENSVPVLMAVSSADGVTPVVVYADSNGSILVSN